MEETRLHRAFLTLMYDKSVLRICRRIAPTRTFCGKLNVNVLLFRDFCFCPSV